MNESSLLGLMLKPLSSSLTNQSIILLFVCDVFLVKLLEHFFGELRPQLGEIESSCYVVHGWIHTLCCHGCHCEGLIKDYVNLNLNNNLVLPDN
jgi:hypothetical protein